MQLCNNKVLLIVFFILNFNFKLTLLTSDSPVLVRGWRMRDVQKDVQLLDMVSMAYVGVQEHCPHSLGFSYIYFVLTL